MNTNTIVIGDILKALDCYFEFQNTFDGGILITQRHNKTLLTSIDRYSIS